MPGFRIDLTGRRESGRRRAAAPAPIGDQSLTPEGLGGLGLQVQTARAHVVDRALIETSEIAPQAGPTASAGQRGMHTLTQ